MSQLLTVDGVEYLIHKPDSEQELEEYVTQQATQIFGEQSLYLPVKTKLKTPSGIGSIPDAYAIQLNPMEWFIIEIELSTHPVFDHIVPQLSKFAQGFRNPQTRRNLVEVFYDAIKNDPVTEVKVRQQLGSADLHRQLTSLLDNEPTLVIVIDSKTRELEEACSSIPLTNKKVIEFNIYKRRDSGLKTAFLFNAVTDPIEKQLAVTESRLVLPGEFPIFFTYKGKRYEATWINSKKIIYQGKEYTSPSALSIEISGTSRNGWRDWKYLDEKGAIRSIEELRK